MARQPDDKTAATSKSDDSALIRELALLLDETNLTAIGYQDLVEHVFPGGEWRVVSGE